MNININHTGIKKTGLCFLLAVVIFYSCKKDNSHLFSQSPDQRLNEALAKYQSQLSGAQYGWKGTIYPAGGGIFSFYFKFNDSNRVQMLSAFDSASAVTLKESSYRLKALEQPSLLFDTYSYLHVLSDPDPSVNGGALGAGLRSDFEFYFDSTTTDTMSLVGRLNGSRLLLVRASQPEASAFLTGQLANGFQINKIITYFKRITIGSRAIDININPSQRTIAEVDASGNLLDSSKVTPYFISMDGIAFAKPLQIGNQTFNGISNLSPNASAGTISCTINNSPATISSVIVPLKVDVGAATRWWNFKASGGNYWISAYGFHDNGVDDADRIDTLSSGGFPYYYLIYWPGYQSNYDVFTPVFVNNPANALVPIAYANLPNPPNYTSDGRAIFSLLSNYGTYPTAGPAAKTSARLFVKTGYYFIQTSSSTYDMVSALDGKSWINWQ